MTLSKEERELLGADGDGCSAADDKAKAIFAGRITPHLQTVEDELALLVTLKKISAADAAIHFMYIEVLRSKDTRPGDRLKAMEGLAKLRGLFVQHVVSHGNLDDVRDKPTGVLLRELLSKLSIAIPATLVTEGRIPHATPQPSSSSAMMELGE